MHITNAYISQIMIYFNICTLMALGEVQRVSLRQKISKPFPLCAVPPSKAVPATVRRSSFFFAQNLFATKF